MDSTRALENPPRAIPAGLRLKVLAHRDVTGSLLFLVPAAAALIAAVSRPDTALRIGLVLVGCLLLVRGFGIALPVLSRGMATLGRMRTGFATLGRIASCHLAWDGAGQEMPYREFLEDWAVKVAKSQTGKASGCAGMLVVLVFVVPLALMMLVVALVLAAGALQIPIGEPTAADLDVQYLAKWFAMGLLFIASTLVILRLARKTSVDAVVPYMEWRSLAKPGEKEVYDEHAMRLVELAKERGEQISLKVPLPTDYSGVELICKLEYSVMGEPCTGVGRVRLSNRLDLAGVERVLFDPLERGKVDFFAGLPDEVQIDAQGRWSDVPVRGAAVGLAFTGTVAAVAIAALLWNVPWLYAMLAQTQ